MTETVDAPTDDLLATPEQLGAYSQEGDVEHADLLLAGASAVVRSYVGWHVAGVTTTTDVVVHRGAVLLLPTLKLVSLDALDVDGQGVDVAGWRTTPWGIVLPPRGGYLLSVASVGQVVTATFTHGHRAAPADVRAVVLAVATRMLTNPSGVTQESTGGYSVLNATNSTPGLVAVERAILDRHRLPPRA